MHLGKKKIIDAPKEVISLRLDRKYKNVDSSYDSALNGLKRLILEHKKLEKGKDLDARKLNTIVSELQLVTNLYAN